MSKKNLYYRTQLRRENPVKEFFLAFFSFFASGARLLLEVFIRKDFGERYFRLSAAILLAAEVSFIPVILIWLPRLFQGNQGESMEDAFSPDGIDPLAAMPIAAPNPWLPYVTWYVFVALFLGFCIKHHLDSRRAPSVFDFEKFSLSTGKLEDHVTRIPFMKTNNLRLRECFLEPALFAVPALLLIAVGQHIGWFILICSFCYCMSYLKTYHQGDNFIMDIIDEMLMNEAMERDFVDGDMSDGNNDIVLRAKLPSDAGYRTQLLKRMIDDTEDDKEEPALVS